MIESAEEFVRLRSSSDPAEYHRAAHEEASEAVWREAIQKYPDMKEWVAHNKTVPIAILEFLSDDADRRVRWSVAVKRKLTPALFEKLAADRDEVVRKCIALNRKVPLNVLETLASDDCPLVRDAAKERLAERSGSDVARG